MRTASYLLIFFILNTVLNAQKVKTYELSAEFFPDHARMYDVPVSAENFMQAVARIELAMISGEKIPFFLHGELTVDSVSQDGEKISFTIEKVLYYYDYGYLATRVILDASKLDTGRVLTVYYSGFFNPSRMRSLSDYMRINKKEGVFLRSYGYSLWFPVFLDSGQDSYAADFKHVTISVPADLKVLVAGELISEKVENDIMTAVWKPGIMDISEIQCTARPYSVVSNEDVFVYHINNTANATRIIDYVHDLKEIYARHLRNTEKPKPIYIMEMPEYGNISSDNIVGLTSKVFNDFEKEISSKLTIAHELVHPYVRIPVTMNNPFYALVIEGFPSFFQIYVLKKFDDRFDLKGHMKQLEKKYLKKRDSDRYPIEKPILQITPDEIGDYKDRFVLNDRVWLFFYDLWIQMGTDKFDAFLSDLFTFDEIDYNSFEDLILKFIPNYKDQLHIWLNTTNYTGEMSIK